MKLSEQLVQTAIDGNEEFREKGGMDQIDLGPYIHEDERLMHTFHGAVMGAVMGQVGIEAVLTLAFEWAYEALRRYGMPDDLHEIPTRLVTLPDDKDPLEGASL